MGGLFTVLHQIISLEKHINPMRWESKDFCLKTVMFVPSVMHSR